LLNTEKKVKKIATPAVKKTATKKDKPSK